MHNNKIAKAGANISSIIASLSMEEQRQLIKTSPVFQAVEKSILDDLSQFVVEKNGRNVVYRYINALEWDGLSTQINQKELLHEFLAWRNNQAGAII